MTQPRARNGNANGAVGGGPSSVHSGGRYLHGICGDAPGGSQTYNRVGTVQETYVAGQSAEFKVAITAHHMGFFEFELCDDAGNLSEECFAEHRLLKENCECSSSGQCDACRRWWKPLIGNETSSWVARDYQGPVIDGQYLSVVEFTMKYTIPAGVQTSNGVIRWHYMTTNSCTSQSSAPEEFWNCADVAITDGGSAGGAISFDNSALASEQPLDLRPAINDGSLAGVYSACPTNVDGALQGVGAASDYAGDCGISGQGCSGSGGEVVDGSSAGGAAGPVESPTPAPAGSSPTPSATSGNGCVAVPGNSQAATDEHCAPCATGQSWWPCDVAGLCQCAGSSGEPEPEPEPESEHSTGPSASPTPAPATATETPEPTPVSEPVPEPEGSKQLVAFVENWLPCPSLDKIRGYDKVIVSFAVSYVWSATKNLCDQSCTIGMPATCNNQAQPDLIQEWRQAGTKVLLSFGGAGMGGSWAGDVNDCWEHCFGRVDSVVSRLVEIIDSQGFDGVDIDYEYDHSDTSSQFLKDLTTGLRTALPAGKIISHAPMDGDIAVGAPYFSALQEVASSVDYLLPQYYNGPFRPATDTQPAIDHMGHLVNDIFGGDASKVVFGFCISDCSGTGSNVNSAQAASILEDVAAAFPGYGGAFLWAASDDDGWSAPVRQALGSAPSAGPSPTPPVPTPTPAPTEAPATPSPTPAVPTPTPAPTEAPATPSPTPAVPTPTPAPTEAPATPPPTPAVATPTPAPTEAPTTGQGERCAGALNGPCSGGCLATNDVCYTAGVDTTWCADRAGIGFVWCDAPALTQAHRAKTRRHAFLGTALLQAASPRSRLLPTAEL